MVATAAYRDIFVEANGLRHHLIARGHPGAPVVMMIHGLTVQAHSFDGIASILAAKYHVYCLDVRGRGESEWGPPDGYQVKSYVADLEAVREALGLDRFALVGTSMGALIAMHYAPKFSERVTKVILNDAGPEIEAAGLVRILAYVEKAPEAFPDMKSVVAYYRQQYAPMLGHFTEDQVADFARWNVRLNDIGVYVWKLDPAVRARGAAGPQEDLWALARAIRCPVLIVRGAESDILGPDVAKRMVEAIPDARLVEVPGVGHAPGLTEPAALNAIEAFLAG